MKSEEGGQKPLRSIFTLDALYQTAVLQYVTYRELFQKNSNLPHWLEWEVPYSACVSSL